MFFGIGFKNKTVKELRKKQGFTAKDLAIHLKVNTTLINKIDYKKIKDIPDPLKSKLIPVLKGKK